MPAHDDLRLADFDYDLPSDLIAQHPLPDRTASRLLDVGVGPGGAPLVDRRFADLPALMAAGDLLVCNDTRVIKARLFGRKPTGGRVEVLVERIVAADRAWALVRTSHAPGPGTRLQFGGEAGGAAAGDDAGPAVVATGASGPEAGVAAPADAPVTCTVAGRHGDLFELVFDADVAATLDRYGQVPLPPYITHAPDADDAARYQTVFAAHPGAVAAPTAGLHFTPALLDELADRGVRRIALTLHVGAGTFQPVRVDRIAEHRMHAERYRIDAAVADAVAETRARGGRIWAVGTTTLRALESAVDDAGRLAVGEGETAIFIRPGFRFRVADRLVTNFHLPRSTLLMLVAAFAGLPRIRAAYAHAVAARYRFFSYGDAMLLARAADAGTA